MKHERAFPRLTVTPKAERSLKSGHPWVYGEEVTDTAGAYQNGDLVRDYIPYVQNGTPGLLDLVEGVFYPSASTTVRTTSVAP